MSDKRPIRGWRLMPIYDPAPGSLVNAGTTMCIATGEYLLHTDVGEALSPAIVKQLRRTDVARTILDADLVDAAIEFLASGPALHRVRVGTDMLTREQVAERLKRDQGGRDGHRESAL